MITDLKPYSRMKDSGVEWLGEVPIHWKIRRLKTNVLNVIEQTNGDGGFDSYIALEHVESWTGRIQNVGSKTTFDSQVKRFRSGDVLFGKLRPYLAKVARPIKNGVCVGEFLVLRPRNQQQTGFYLEQFLRSKPVIDVVNASTFGAKMPRVDWQFIGSLQQVVPPLLEQAAIVKYLDYVDRRMRRLIRAKRKLIVLLTEQKQAIIHHAVTRGLDPGVPLKDSGVEWLGEVPEHWEIVRLRTILAERTRNGLYKSQDHYAGDGTPIVQMGEAFAYPIIEVSAADRVRLSIAERETWGLREGDLLFARRSIVFEGSGKCSIVGKLPEQNVFESSMIRVRPDLRTVYPKFLFLFFQSGFSRSQILSITKQVTISGINGSQLKGLIILLPPRFEQKEIVKVIKEKSQPLDNAIEKVENEIRLLKEYRFRLIADVVTGKIDVREAAATIPEVDSLAANVEPDDTLDNDIEADLDELEPIPEEDDT